MSEPRIPDRSAEPALQKSLDRGPQAHTAAHSEDVARDAGKGPQENPDHEPSDEHEAEPGDEEVEQMTGVPPASKDLSQM
jgi:hypothetical protein